MCEKEACRQAQPARTARISSDATPQTVRDEIDERFDRRAASRPVRELAVNVT